MCGLICLRSDFAGSFHDFNSARFEAKGAIKDGVPLATVLLLLPEAIVKLALIGQSPDVYKGLTR